MQGAESIGMSVKFPSMVKNKYQRALISNDLALVVTHNDHDKKVTLASYGLTDLGKQVTMLGKFGGNRQYLLSIAQKIIKQGFDVKIGDWQYVKGKQGLVTNHTQIEEIGA